MKIPFTRYAIKQHNAAIEKQYQQCVEASTRVFQQSYYRCDLINALLLKTERKRYLEIGVRNPADNFNRIKADYKVSVDPGVESTVNEATFPMSSDAFFEKLHSDSLEIEHRIFDVIFIDGLHLAEQAYRDIQNSLRSISDRGYIVLHDCNPPTVFHAREDYGEAGPACRFWNGTTWKAFQRYRTESTKRCFVVDVDWGVGVIVNDSHDPQNRLSADVNPFYEYSVFCRNRQLILNLCDVAEVDELRAISRG